jgi:hydrogenase maturation protein HypF
LSFSLGDGLALATGEAALAAAARLIAEGKVLALKGLGGYQLMVDARSEDGVALLRTRKHRPDKPFAVMVRNLAAARRYCHVDAAEAALLSSAAAPIVLLERRGLALAATLAPGLRTLGVMLPTTPLHHLLLETLNAPLVCTSGNRGDEPICIDADEALERLGDIADGWLSHDRTICRALDDSVARIIDGAPQLLRVGRGYAPVVLPYPASIPALACGGQLKNTVAVAAGGRVIVSQHLGDLEHARCLDAMHAAAADLRSFHHVDAALAAVDLHPDYASDADGPGGSLPRYRVQHHLAHALAVMLEHGLNGPLLAVVWDGSGLGSDGTLWGGEFLVVERRAGVRWQRVAALREFSLLGGDAAAHEPQRALSGLCWEVEALRGRVPPAHREVLARAINAPRTSSAGRLFDGIAALLGFDARQSYSGQAATRLEHVAAGRVDEPYPLACVNGRLDWAPLLLAIERDQRSGTSNASLSMRFHASLADAIVGVARSSGLATVVLSGGCFQNRLLTELTVAGLRRSGLTAVLARRLPPHDGALAAGQLVAAIEGVTQHVPGRTGTN